MTTRILTKFTVIQAQYNKCTARVSNKYFIDIFSKLVTSKRNKRKAMTSKELLIIFGVTLSTIIICNLYFLPSYY